MSRDAAGNYIARRGEQNVRPVFSPPLPEDELPPAGSASAGQAPKQFTTAEKLAILEKALDRYRVVIEVQQKQLTAEHKLRQAEEERRQTQEELIQALRAEMETLRREIDALKGK
jgi:hypothetical protein